MQNLTQIFITIFPFFALILCGYLATYLRVLPLSAIPGLNIFVLYFALPCMLFRFGQNTPIAQLFNLPAFLIYVSAAFIMLSFVIANSLRSQSGSNGKPDWNNASFGALVAAFPNTGFMGLPLLISLYGKAAAGTVILTIMIDMIITSSVALALSRLGAASDKQNGLLRTFLKTLLGIASNPMPWAILLGVAATLLRVTPLAPVRGVVNLLADAASPVALFTIGAVIARAQFSPSTTHSKPKVAEYLPIALFKIILHPVLIYLLARSAQQLGLPLSDFTLQILVLTAALPSASNISLLAERYHANNSRVAMIILSSTVIGFITFGLVNRLFS